MVKYCINCGEQIHPKRIEIIPSTKTCVVCSNTKTKKSLTLQLGEGEDTYNDIIFIDADEFEKMEKYIDPRSKFKK